jgi:hypothetical protein
MPSAPANCDATTDDGPLSPVLGGVLAHGWLLCCPLGTQKTTPVSVGRPTETMVEPLGQPDVVKDVHRAVPRRQVDRHELSKMAAFTEHASSVDARYSGPQEQYGPSALRSKTYDEAHAKRTGKLKRVGQ